MAASGIAEDFSPIEELSDDILAEKTEVEEEKKGKKMETSKRDEMLLTTGEEIRKSAMRRRAKLDDNETPKKRISKDSRSLDEMSDWNDMIKEQLKRKQKQDEANMRFSEEEIRIMRER